MKRVSVSASDTTGEIYLKALSIKGLDKNFKEITEIYDFVRYKDILPGREELIKAEENYHIISDIIKNHK